MKHHQQREGNLVKYANVKIHVNYIYFDSLIINIYMSLEKGSACPEGPALQITCMRLQSQSLCAWW